MSRGLAGLISVLGGAGAAMSGYAKGQKQFAAGERQKKLDAQQDEQYQYDKGQRDKATALDNDVGAAMADRTLDVVTPPDLSNGNADVTMAGPQPTQYRVGDQSYADEGAARMALQGVNSQAAKFQRAADAAATHGVAGVDKAQLYQAFAKRALDEGSDQILSAIQASAPSVEQVKKAGGVVASTVGEDAAGIFNKTGAHWKVAPDTTVQHYIDKDAAGREFVNARVLGKDGKPVVDDVHHAGLMLQDFKTRLEAQRADTQAYQTGQQITQSGARDTEAARHNKATEDEARTSNAALRGIQGRTLALAEAKDKREATLFKNQTIDGQLEQIVKAIGPLSPDDEKAYRKKLLGIGQSKDQDTAFINDVVKKWGENNPTATAAQVAAYRADLAGSLVQAGSNKQVEGALKEEFTKNPFGSAGYNQTHADAKAQLHLTDAQLAALGYPPPAAPAAPRIAAQAGVRPAVPQPGSSDAPIDVRNDPTLQALNEGIQRLDPNNPAHVPQLMALGTAKNERLAQLQANYGSMTKLQAD